MMDDMMWWYITCYDFFLNLYDDAYMDVWMHEWNFLFFIYHFSFILIWKQGKQGLEASVKTGLGGQCEN